MNEGLRPYLPSPATALATLNFVLVTSFLAAFISDPLRYLLDEPEIIALVAAISVSGYIAFLRPELLQGFRQGVRAIFAAAW